ncbi:MAG: DNA polymerase III subunit gamma/tau [Solirubrobacterales bacterium]|nr:DNA polymerase III subunit gamma/tau [Solirubrobacterales bacterium]OJU94576.1 MAG: DNA polymerase III, subunit gamma and tau [Solirubrobacterales bacterium 67-14]
MSESTSLYRRHRPHSFDQVVGQQHVVRTLSNAITQDKVHHAYLFVGSRGTGKTSMAKILAASLNCANGGPTLTPCGTCESCLSIAAGNSVDVIEMDAASNRSVDDIRELRDRVAFAPTAGRWKVYILDEAHMLTKEAWNAFLKTLEEPPPNTVFILATTEAHKVMPTIADRCQRFDFQRPSIEQLSEVLARVSQAESIAIDPPAISMISRSASGSFRDALGTLDQLVSYSGNQVALDDVLEVLGAADADLLFSVVDKVTEADAAGVLTAVEQVARSGRDPARFARDLLGHLRVLLVTQTTGQIPEAFAVTAADPDRLVRQAQAIGPANLIRTIDELSAALGLIRDGDEARLAVEVALLKAARPDFDPSSEGLARRLERLESGIQPAPQPPIPEAGGGAASVGDPVGRTSPGVPTGPPTEPASNAQSDTFTETSEAGSVGDVPGTPGEVRPGTSPTDPAPTPVETTPEPFDLGKLEQVWPAVLDSVAASGSGMVASYFDGTRPMKLEDSKLTVGFPAGAAFNRKNAERPECLQQLGAAVTAVTGDQFRLEYDSLEGGQQAADPESEVMDEEDFVARVKSEFNAEEVI